MKEMEGENRVNGGKREVCRFSSLMPLAVEWLLDLVDSISICSTHRECSTEPGGRTDATLVDELGFNGTLLP
jgi:hypothetical protein